MTDTDPTHIADLLDQGAIAQPWRFGADTIVLVLGGTIEATCSRAQLAEARKIRAGGR